MKYLIKNASVSKNGNPILESINFEITDHSHIGIVGKNGSGKTTFLECLIDNELLEEGVDDEPFEVSKIGNFSIGYQKQVVFPDENITLVEELEKSFKEIKDLEKKIAILYETMENNPTVKNINDYSEALDHFQLLGGYAYKKEYEIMLSKFGFKNDDKTRKISSFSGGERTKIAFIKLLLSRPDILLLDEPTNHLDVETIIWLEEYLKNYKKAFIIVSHDRMFLNNTVSIIYDISGGKLTKYVGNYENYEKVKQANYEKALKDYEMQQKEIDKLKQLYLKYRFKPTKAGLAMSRLKRLEKMEILAKPDRINTKAFKTNLNKIEPSSKQVLTLKNLAVGYDKILAKIDLEVSRGQKIAIIGANGTGKSTLLKTINGILKQLSGTISMGFHVTIGYFDQNLKLNEENTILEEFSLSHPELLEKEMRSALGAFLFTGEDVHKKIKVLSGGEKVRLILCQILYNKPNLLLLDEPTNHLDITSKQRLEEILKDYPGTIIFVSHDRYFVKKIATDLIVFDKSMATYYPYGYDTYEKKRQEEGELAKSQKMAKNLKNKENFRSEQKQIKKIENDINKEEANIKRLNEHLASPEVYNDFQKSKEISEVLQKANDNLLKLYQTWENLQKDK